MKQVYSCTNVRFFKYLTKDGRLWKRCKKILIGEMFVFCRDWSTYDLRT